ncbi:MAG: NUDIX hydrolase [Bacteroidales bacterium]|jgi:ADP-ribose pyrophosphatase YjhB (NUDIX family)|nr:NUDIX hydrolase [Bacteroidales bacterium]MCI1785085.1 NUDIX hydrolase [Bacteroidales bacterium]
MEKETAMDNAINEKGKWKVLKSEYLFKRPWLTVRQDCVKIPNGQINDEYYVIEYPDWVNIIAVTEDGKFVMERQYRHGLGKTCFEIPAGVMEKGESPLQAAKRELQEETGYGEGKWTEAMSISGNSSTTNNISHCFIAEDVKRISGQHLDRTEDIDISILTVDQVRNLLLGDKVKQSLMAAPLWRYFALNKLI